MEPGTHPLEEEWVALDVETTGLSPDADEIIEVGAVKFRGGDVLDTFHSLVNPHRRLSAFIRRHTGITQDEVDGAPPFSRVAGGLESFVGGLPIVGHSIDFDLGFLAAKGVRFTNPKADTFDLAYVLRPSGGYSLEKLAAALGVAHEGAHRALEDAKATSRVFHRLLMEAEGLDANTLAEMYRLGTRSSWVLAYILRRLEGHKASPRSPAALTEAELERRAGTSVTGIDLSALRERMKHEPPLKPNSVPRPVKVRQVRDLLGEGGRMSQTMDGFEERTEQVEMAEAVMKAINNGERLIVEAGTGVGKTMAYLLPAALYALKNKVRVFVSTNTINLQEQILHKDAPAVVEALQGVEGVPIEDFRYTVLKGRGNYLCLKRWAQLRGSETLSSEEARMLSKLLVWTGETCTGDRSELNLSGHGGPALWDRVSAPGAFECPGVNGACFLRKSRNRADNAHLVIVNHALLMTLAKSGMEIPETDVLIIDEAQHLEDVATDQLGFKVDKVEIDGHLDLLGGERGLAARIVPALRASAAAQTRLESVGAAAQRIVEAIPMVRDVVATMLTVLGGLLGPPSEAEEKYGQKLRVTTGTRSRPAWSNAEKEWQRADVALGELDSAISALYTSMEGLEDAGIRDYQALVKETDGLRGRTGELRQHLMEFVSNPDENGIYWLSLSDRYGLELNMAPLHVGELLEKHVYSQRRSVVLTSATLTTNGSFEHIIDRTGFSDATEVPLGSPFDYPNSALLCIPNDMSEPSSWNYQADIEQAIMDAALAAGGATMALFTSHGALRGAAKALKSSLRGHGFDVLAQGIDGAPSQLVQRFVENPKSVLLGTSSFWEGVDLAGDALRVLLVAKLPFSVPTDPVFSARSELYEERAFYEYAMPQAILRLRQGFGRLIRTKRDRGVVVILDKRVISRRYGKMFLGSLPLPLDSVETPPSYEMPGKVRRWLDGR